MEEPIDIPVEDEEAHDSGLSFSAFADAHYTLQTAQLGSPVPGHRAYAGASSSPSMGNAYVSDNGFSLNFVGLDAVYDQPEYGATISLRAGPKMRNYHFNSDPNQFGIENLTQGYVTWRPADNVDLDLGMFGTIFGAEVLESWQNLNYSRGALYFAAQPFWHTGLRASFAATDMISITGMIVNDANTTWSTDNPDANAPVFALQLGVTPNDMFSVSAGGMIAPDKDTASGLETFFDLVATLTIAELTAILNADLNIDREGGAGGEDFMIMGASLALGYQFTSLFGAAVRGEVITTDDGDDMTDEEALVTGTLTLDFKPVDDNLILRVEGRAESQTNGFVDADGDPSDTWLAATIGAVVTTN